MANTKSSIKDIRKTERRSLFNDRIKDRLKRTVKGFLKLISSNDLAKAKESLSQVSKILDKAAQKKVIKKETASRKKSRLTKQLNKVITAKKNVKDPKKKS